MISPETILQFAHENNIDATFTSNRLRFKYCPHCGSEKSKVWIYSDSLFGSCFKCHSVYSAYSYLLKMVEPSLVHGLFAEYAQVKLDDDCNLHLPDIFTDENKTENINNNIIEPIEIEASRFFRIDDRPKHIASSYAIKRGVPIDLYHQVLIDVHTRAVCFLVHKENQIVGYQLRFVNPIREKTYTLKGMMTSQNMIVYERPESNSVFICEGPFNAISAYNWGFTGICLFGSRLSSYHLQQVIKMSQNKKIYCAFDKDSSGHRAFLQTKLLCDMYDIEVFKVEPEVGNDLNDSWQNDKYFKIVEDNSSIFTHLDLNIDLFKGSCY